MKLYIFWGNCFLYINRFHLQLFSSWFFILWILWLLMAVALNFLEKKLIWEPCFLDYKISERYFSFLQPTNDQFSQAEFIPCHHLGSLGPKLVFDDKRAKKPITMWSSLLPHSSIHVHVADYVWGLQWSCRTLFCSLELLRVFWCHWRFKLFSF